jgi:hypothetical protein
VVSLSDSAAPAETVAGSGQEKVEETTDRGSV